MSFSALQRAENSSMLERRRAAAAGRVSVLFSEPKIPQFNDPNVVEVEIWVSVLFSEPKIPQFYVLLWLSLAAAGFSALQRAENSSIVVPRTRRHAIAAFQCSSASRKFLKNSVTTTQSVRNTVSVLFSEPKIPQRRRARARPPTSRVSVLFSEPKIPQVARNAGVRRILRVSVLFSEPKIPQSGCGARLTRTQICFSALQRAENSSIAE